MLFIRHLIQTSQLLYEVHACSLPRFHHEDSSVLSGWLICPRSLEAVSSRDGVRNQTCVAP